VRPWVSVVWVPVAGPVLGWTPLHYASQEGQVDAIKCLVELKADVNAKNDWGWTPLDFASSNGQVDAIECLIELKADVNAKDEYGRTPLHRASQEGQVDAIECLVELKADVNAKNDWSETPLDLARRRQKSEAVKCLENILAEEKRKAEEEAEKRRKAAEAETKRKAEEAEKKRKAEEAEAEKRRKAEEAETKRKAEEAEKKRKAEEAEKKLIEKNCSTFKEGKYCKSLLESIFSALKGSHPQGIPIQDEIFDPIAKALFPEADSVDILFSAGGHDLNENDILQYEEFCQFMWNNQPDELRRKSAGVFEKKAFKWLKQKRTLAKNAGYVFTGGRAFTTLSAKDIGDAKYTPAALLSLLKSRGLVPIKASEAKTNRTVHVDAKSESWQKESLLGEGSYGAVYAVEKTVVKKRYAAKAFDLTGKNKKAKDHILRECGFMANLATHPNIIGYVDTIKNGDILCIVMEMCPKELSSVVRGPKVKADEIKRMMLGISRGLKHLHGQTPAPILHRDLKADNILISETGDCKIADIGLATEGGRIDDLNTAQLQTLANTKGRAEYQAPENVSDGGSADMWAVGLILVELATNKLIKDNREMKSATRGTAAFKEKKMISGLIKEVKDKTGDAQLATAVTGLLEYDPKKRMTASELVDLLDPKVTLEELKDGQNDIKSKVDAVSQKLDKVLTRLDGLFQTVLNLNMDDSLKLVPRFVVLVPGNYKKANDGVFGFFSGITNRATEWTGIQETFHLWICDEGPSLLGLKTPPKKPMHAPLQIRIPGATLRRMAPLLRALSALLVVAKFVASASPTGLGNVIPDGLPFAKDLTRKAGEWSNVANNLVEVEETLAEFDVDVHNLADNAQRGVEAKKDLSSVNKSKRAVGKSYKVLKEILIDAKPEERPKTENGETLQDLLRTTVVRVVHPDGGSIHWVSKGHIGALEKKGFKYTDAVDVGHAASVPGATQCCTIA